VIEKRLDTMPLDFIANTFTSDKRWAEFLRDTCSVSRHKHASYQVHAGQGHNTRLDEGVLRRRRSRPR
jgi:hypothetical protein